MASLSTDPHGNRSIQFKAVDGKRRTIRLGTMTKKLANEVKIKVETLAGLKAAAMPLDLETSRWVSAIGDDLAAKLAAAGLIGERGKATLGGFIREYIDGRADVKDGTRYNLVIAKTRMLEFFPADATLRSITAADADRWRIHLKGRYAEATAARTLKHGRQFFHAACRAKLIDANPFEGIKPGRMDNPERLRFINAADAEKIIDACPNAEWRAIIALARYGGLRTPSETLALTWGDIRWDEGKFRVRSSKLEHTANKGIRWVPLFPELRPHLEALFDEAPAGSVYVISKTRDTRTNFRTELERIIHRGTDLEWIAKPFQNMRASRETELAAEYPLHVVTSWIGNSAPIAAKHYLQVTDDDFARAASRPKSALQNPVQSGAERGENERSGEHRGCCETLGFPDNSAADTLSHLLSVCTDYPARIRT